MEFYTRKLLLVNEDVPISTSISPLPHIQVTEPTATNSSSPRESTATSPSSSTFRSPLQLPLRPIFTSNVAYTFLVLFTTFFFLAFVLLSIHQFSFRRRRRPPSSCQGGEIAAGKSLPVTSYRGDAKQVECVICLEEFREGDMVKVIPYCTHVFHPECIDTWLAAHVTCPICRCAKLCGGIADERAEGSTAEIEREEVGSG
ncbi:Zinc finger, RING-type [Sesbania bispinosa]|nr:Zinc finger, RING-type [Sesbania bispinosa]